MADPREEEFAALAHEQWSGWTRYLLGECEELEGSTIPGSGIPPALVIRSSLVEHWTRQMNTPYAELSEEEKESDRVEARKVIALLEEAV